ncbi:MAG: cytochrome-c peroxidase [Flavobacteriales bacterium]|nr:cytochrome-c peroxidase [Flavobacteriales bacterium]
MAVKTYLKIFAVAFCASAILFACQKDDESDNGNDSGVKYDDTPYQLEVGILGTPNIPADNPLTVEGVKLGRMLFYEKRFSKNNLLSCAGCHRQEHAFTDTARFSLGVRNKEGSRQSMSVFNMAWNSNEFFWDGRAHLLRDQSLMPIEDSLEMDESLENVIQKLSADQQYKDQFTRAFGSPEITTEKMSLAMEQFMNSIVSNDSKYDRYINGLVSLDSNEERGRVLFFSEFNPAFPSLSGADCQHCHSAPNFENDAYMNNGLDTDAQMTDNGRMKATNSASDKGKFKVPSLRNIELTAPYMHDGRFETLEEVIDHYNVGLQNSTTLDPTLVYPLNNGGLQLTEEDKRDLIAFLKTLTDYSLITNPEFSDPFKN